MQKSDLLCRLLKFWLISIVLKTATDTGKGITFAELEKAFIPMGLTMETGFS